MQPTEFIMISVVALTVIYVDVLLVVNFFITFLLLLITQKLAKENSKLVRLVLASFAGAAYSLVILFDELDFAVSLLGKLAAACLIVLIAFRRSGLKCFAKNTAIFFFVNFVFVGIMVGLWMIFKPAGIVINNSTVYFDVSALSWGDDEYVGLFENLAFQEKNLSYSLAVRDEDKELFVAQGIRIPTLSTILTKLNEVFFEEYGSDATASMKKCIALSGSGEETIIGILAISEKCKQMGLLVHVAHIGKKLNIKFYTLFMPNSNSLMDQKQQALSLYKKLSPSVAMWESSLKDTILFAIQQLLNSASEYPSGNIPLSDNDPVF